MRVAHYAALLLVLAASSPAMAQRWVTSWAAGAQGPYPSGITAAQPELRFALPEGAVHDQTFRLIVKPSLWGKRVRLRFSNVLGTAPLLLDGVFVGLQQSGAALSAGSNRPVTFKAKKAVTIPPGADAWSDAVTLPFVGDPAAAELQGRKLAVSLHVAEAGAATWHALAMQTSYITGPGAGALGELEDDGAFPNSTTSAFFLDALDVQAAPDASAVVCLGDGVTDGQNTTLNGDDRWPDMLAKRLGQNGTAMAVVDEGIAGNLVAAASAPVPEGGPPATDRLERDVIGLSGVSHVIWMQGLADLRRGATVDQVKAAMTEAARRLRGKIKGVKLLGATLTPLAGSAAASPELDARRRALNEFIRNSGGVFDAVLDFERATIDRGTGGLSPEFVPNGTVGGPGDFLHPNRAGAVAMADAVDLRLLHAPPKPKPRPRPAEDSGDAE